MARRSASVELSVEQTEQLERWIRVGGTPQQVVLRAKIVRQASEGSSDKQIATDLSVHPRPAGRPQRLKPTRSSANNPSSAGEELRPSPCAPSHILTYFIRSADQRTGSTSIHRAWQDHQLKPHLTKTFKLSRDPQFVEKLNRLLKKSRLKNCSQLLQKMPPGNRPKIENLDQVDTQTSPDFGQIFIMPTFSAAC